MAHIGTPVFFIHAANDYSLAPGTPWTAARTLLLLQALDRVDRLFSSFCVGRRSGAFERLDRGLGRALCLQIDLEGAHPDRTGLRCEQSPDCFVRSR